MAHDAGIVIAPTRLVEEGRRAHFMTRRFDRPGSDGKRLHLQTLCALDGLDFNQSATHDYANLMLRVDALTGSATDRQEVLRRAAFNVLAKNSDDHTKNHSFLMDCTGRWSLAPAYDLIFAHDPTNRWLARHQMSVEGKFEGITRRDLMTFADRFDVPAAKATLDEVAAAIANWEQYAREAGLSPERTAFIAARLTGA
jgi:serine/threonine-protein kinase HipA